MSSCNTPSPTPTLSASSPSFAAPASSPSASRTRSGNSSTRSSPGMTGPVGTVPITVGPPVLVRLGFAPITVPSGPDEAGGPPSSSSTDYGTTSSAPVAVLGRREGRSQALWHTRGNHDHGRSFGHGDRYRRDLHVRLQQAELELSMPAERIRLVELQLTTDLPSPGARRAHLRGPRHRRQRQRR